MDATKKVAMVLGVVLFACATGDVFANGGPFVVKYPNGDPAAKGVLARLAPDLKPARETRLRVVKEDLKVSFVWDRFGVGAGGPNGGGVVEAPPLARVSAAYTIENPTDKEIEVDYGFPILRGVYVSPLAMVPVPDAQVRLNEKTVLRCNIISNSSIYGIIRQQARETIDRSVAGDAPLSKLVATVHEETDQVRKAAACLALTDYLTGPTKWNERDAALLAAYASLDFGETLKIYPPDRSPFDFWYGKGEAPEHIKWVSANLGPLAAIGEQKATQFLAHLASRFDPKAAATYEAIFTAWGGDVRERSVDLKTGKVRPREITVAPDAKPDVRLVYWGDPTIYARVDYLNENANISEAEKTTCKTILRDLPVVFTFAPMNLLHYQVKFPPKATQILTVAYSQYAYMDTRSPSSYQLAYVVHPASLWNEFGPINLEVAVPAGVPFRASVSCKNGGTEEREILDPLMGLHNAHKGRFDIYRGDVKDKTGEIFLAVDTDVWKNMVKTAISKPPSQQVLKR